MTNHETINTAEEFKQKTPSVNAFRETFLRHVARYSTDPNYEDMKADIRELSLDDPSQIQQELEGGWPTDLDEIRRDALLEAHQAEMGIPSEEEIEKARLASRTELLAREDLKTEQVRVLDVISQPKAYDAEEIDVALTYIEGQIVSESVLGNNPNTLDALRTTRDELHTIRSSYLAEQADKKAQKEIENIRADGDNIKSEAAGEARAKIDEIFEKPTTESQDAESNSNELDEAAEMVPTSREDLVRFDKENFSKLSGKEMADKLPLLKRYIINNLKQIAHDQPEGVAFSDTIASALGGAGGAVQIFKLVVEAKLNGGKTIQWSEFDKMPFSEAAKALNIDVKKEVPDYDKRFITR